MIDRSISTAALAALIALGLTVPMVGIVGADNPAPHEVSIDTTELTSGTEQMVEITVTNPQSSDMTSPVVEIPLRNGLSVAADRRSTQDGTEFVDGVTVDKGSTTEDRTAFINASSFRGTDAVYVEGVTVPAGESRTYAVPITVSGSSEITLEADVRPLNNEGQNVRVSSSIDPVSPGTIDASLSNGDEDITITGSSISDQSKSGAIEVEVPGGSNYDISTTLSTISQPVTISGLQVDEFETATVQFTNPTDDGTVAPVVVAQTSGQAEVVDNSAIRSTSEGTAETRTTQTVTFDLLIGSGETVTAVSAEADLPMTGVTAMSGVDSVTFVGESAPDVAMLNTSGAVDPTASVAFEGRYVGDVTADSTVDGSDASRIAEDVAANETDSLTDYADVSDDGEISAVDAMQIQQYAEGNRTADYSTLNGGS